MHTHISKFDGDVKVMEIGDAFEITLEEIKNFPIQKGDQILFKTRNSSIEWFLNEFFYEYVYLTKEAALFLKEKGVKCIGIDNVAASVNDCAKEIREVLLNAGICVIENLYLANVQPGKYNSLHLTKRMA